MEEGRKVIGQEKEDQSREKSPIPYDWDGSGTIWKEGGKVGKLMNLVIC